jgi:replicative DNA helicase
MNALAQQAERNEANRAGQAALYRNDSNVEHLRQPPCAIDSEQAVLGGMMLSAAALLKVMDMLAPEDFYRRDHQLIYRAILELAEKDHPFDAVTLGDWFDAQGIAEQIAGGAYLIELASTTPSAANVVAYAEIVRDKSTQRKLICVGTEMVNDAFHPGGRDVRELLSSAVTAVNALSGNSRVGGPANMKTIAGIWFEKLQQRRENPEQHMGLLTPWADFNNLVSGFQPGDLVILAGRPSMGKSAIAINVAVAASLAGKRGMYFSLEMSNDSIFNRGVAALGEVPLSWLRTPSDTSESEMYWARVGEAVKRLRNSPLLIDETPAVSAAQVYARAKREHMRQPLDFIVVDHIHLMPLPGKTKEATEVGHITATLKKLGKETGVPVIALAQLNRGLEARASKRPVMADLRESGAIEQDADVVIFVYRDDYYAQAENRQSAAPDVVELIVAKQREGETGTVYLKNKLGFGRVDEMREGYEPPARREIKTKTGWGRKEIDHAV